MAHFYFALTNPEADVLLKEEVKSFYPELKLSYSRPGFLTFKANHPVFWKPLFARVSGTCLGKVKEEDLKPTKAWVWKRSEEMILPKHLQDLSDKTLYKIGEVVTLVMMIGDEEYWVGEYPLAATHFQTPGEVSSIQLVETPSRAYYKIAEAYEAFDLPFDHQERVLELGSAPGGASKFLLDQDTYVLGVDPAEMDPVVGKHIQFKHLKKPFESLTKDDFTKDVDWIISDINLPPTVVLRELDRLLTFLEPRGVVLTLKMNDPKHLHLLQETVTRYKQTGFSKVELKYLPSHRQEIALVALRA